MRTIVKKIGTFLLLAVFLHACSIEKVTYKGVQNIQLREIQGKKIALSCELVLDNPNGHTFKIRPSSFDFYVNDRQLGTAFLDEKVKIIKNKESAVNVPITIELKEGMLPILIAATLKKDTQIRLFGTLKGGVFIFGVKRKIDVSQKLSLRGLKLGNVPFFNK